MGCGGSRYKTYNLLKEEWQKLERKVRSTIWLYFLDSMLLNVFWEDSAKKLGDELGNLYKSKSSLNNLFLWKKLYHPEIEDGDFVTEHRKSLNSLVSQLVFVDINMEEKVKCIALLCSLPRYLDSMVVAIGSTTQSTF